MLGRYLDLGNPVAHDHPLNQGLVAWWLPLPNNQGGGTLFDIEGGNHGTLTSGPTWVAGTGQSQAVSFDGSNDYAAVPVAASTYPFTLMVFARCRNATSYAPCIGVGVAAGVTLGRIGFRGDVGGDPVEAVTTGTSGVYSANSATGFAANEWTLVTGVFRANNDASVYRNTLRTNGSGTPGTTASPNQASLGADHSRGSFAAVDLAAGWVFNRALSDDDVGGWLGQVWGGYPDTLRRWTPRAWVFGGTAAGGTTTQNLAGSSTAAGSLVRAVSKALAGSTTPAGSPALLAAKPLAGSTTAAGTLAMLAAKPLAGSITAAGPLANATAKPLAGSSTATGDLTTVRAVLQSVGGSATPAGTVARAAAQAIAGTTTPVGSAANAVSKPLAGSITPTGIVAKQANLLIAGSTTPAGSLVRTVAQAVAAAVTAVGSLARAVAKALAGAVTGSGALARVGGSEPISVVTPGGTVRRRGNLARVIRRLPANVPRLVRRPSLGVPASRVIRGARPMPTAGEFPTESRVKGAAETVEYLFDFTPFPEIVAGETISSVSVPAVSGLTIGSPAVTAALTDGVAAGKGVEVAISGGTAGTTYAVSCRATMSGGAIREIRLSLTVR